MRLFALTLCACLASLDSRVLPIGTLPYSGLTNAPAHAIPPRGEVRLAFAVDAISPVQSTSDDSPRGSTNFSVYMAVAVGLILLGLSLYLTYQLQRKRVLEEQLKGARRQLKTLYDQAPCGFHTLDKEGYFASANLTLLQWLGYRQDELVGRVRLGEIIAGEETFPSQRPEQLSRQPREVMLKRKDGSDLPVVISALLLESAHETEKWLYTILDNSRCWDALQRIKSLDGELEAFSYSISHDLRAPLRSIDGYSKILQEDYAARLDEDGRRVLNVVMNNARRMGNLIDDLLEFGRLGRKIMQKSVLNMTDIVNNIVQDLHSRQPGRKIDFTVEELAPAFADPDMMHQVWYNLLDNAVKYTGKRELGRVEVRSRISDQGEVVYEVRDNGDGFDMNYAHKLFGVFQRLHKIQDFAGTGVGLAVVKRIVVRHGGRVWAEGAPQNGAAFYFTIPVENEHA